MTGNGQQLNAAQLVAAVAAAQEQPRLRILDVTDVLNNRRWRIRIDLIEGIAPVKIELKKKETVDGEEKVVGKTEVDGVVIRTISANEVCVLGRFEDWHGKIFGKERGAISLVP